MKRKLLSLFFVGSLFLQVSIAEAYWIGNPGLLIKPEAKAIEFVFDTGKREIKPDTGGQTTDLDSRRFYLQMRKGIGRNFQITGRVLPGLGRLDLEGTDFNPVIWGGGVAIQFTPREKLGPVRLGINASYDINFGSSSGDDVTWTEGSVGIGASYPVSRQGRLYGGISIISPNIEFEFNGVKSDFEADNTWGPFIGGNLLLDGGWILSAELHLINEQVFGFHARYRF